MIEKEILGMLEKETYEKKLSELEARYGAPKAKKRLSIMLFDRDNSDLDTRIRITNGEPEFMQKQKVSQDGTNITTKIERDIQLPKDVGMIASFYKSLNQMLMPYDKGQIVKILVQTSNFVWKVDNVEVKISHQFGRSDFYTFEIEVLEEGKTIEEWCDELGLHSIADLDSPEYSSYQSEKVDIDINTLSEEEFQSIIESYLK